MTEDYYHRRKVSKKFLLKTTHIAETAKFQV